MAKKVITRFAPSPTGLLHAGNYRTAIFSYLFARREGGKFILRIEDTDRERSKKEYEENILDSLLWLGLEHDEMHRQSERIPRHTAALERLIASGHAYISKETAKDNSGMVKEIVRFKNPGSMVTFHDLLRGEITMDTTDLGDFVIAKNIKEPLFHLAVVVDDAEMGVTHVIRGDDHIANTPRQLLLYDALGFSRPLYVHLPLILGEDRAKLSKRRGAKALTEYRATGYLPAAIMNFLALLGWNPGDDREFFTKEELVKEFSIEKIQKGGAIFNPKKLDWFNTEYIKRMPSEEFQGYMKPLRELLQKRHKELSRAYIQYEESVLRHSMVKIVDVLPLAETGEYDYLFHLASVDHTALLSKGSIPSERAKDHLKKVGEILKGHDRWDTDAIKSVIMPYADGEGRKEVLWPMRYALSGREKSPDPFFLAYILGKNETLERLSRASALLA